jgi:2-methylcitrate dehydratase
MASRPVLLELARLVHSVRYEDLPRAVVERAKELLLDTLGCAYGGAASATSERVEQVVRALGGAPQSTVLGSGLRTSMPLAAFANGTRIRHHDANDYYFGRDPAHPSGHVATLLAVGEHVGCTGEEFIACMVACYELHLRLCDLAGEPNLWSRGWHHSTNCVFAAAAIAARLLGCDEQTTAHAMAIAGSHQNTLAALQGGEVSQIKSTAEAWAAKAGIEAAMLASAGITGPLGLFEAPHGWARTVAGRVDLEALAAPVSQYRLMQVCTKPYPAVASAMSVIDAAVAARSARSPDAATLERIEVGLPAFVLGTPAASDGRRHPSSKESAEHSLYFCAAVALHEGECGEDSFGAQQLQSPAIAALLRKIVLVEDPEFTRRWPKYAGASVKLVRNDGTVQESRRPVPPGHPENAAQAALARKFDHFAGAVLSSAQSRRLRERVAALEQCVEVGELVAAASSN